MMPLSGMQGRDILVIGDMVADIYLDGRISREAPVLVLEQAGEKVVAGGAANVVNNIATLGGKVHAVGLVGRDKSADGLREILAANGADVRGLIADDSRPTISKTRIIAGGRATVSQQIVRIDRESKAPMAPAVEAELRAYIKSILPQRMKVKLIVVDAFDCEEPPRAVTYYQKEGHISRFCYSPPQCSRVIETVFDEEKDAD